MTNLGTLLIEYWRLVWLPVFGLNKILYKVSSNHVIINPTRAIEPDVWITHAPGSFFIDCEVRTGE